MRVPYRQPSEAPFRNHFMNGGFDLWQRNTTFTSFEGKIADRFAVGYAVTGGKATWSRESSIIPPNGLTPYSLKAQTSIIDAAPAAGALGLLRHRVEGNYFRNLKGRTFYLKGKIYTNVTGDWTIAFSNNGEVNRWLDQINVPTANTWTDFILDVTHNPSIGSWLYDTSVGLAVVIPVIAGTNHQTSIANARNWNTTSGWVITGSANQNFHSSLSNVLYLAQLQLVTDPDEPFQRMGGGIIEELVLCQRYYEKSYDPATVPGTPSATSGVTIQAAVNVSGQLRTTAEFKVPKRIQPIFTCYSPNSGTVNTIYDNNGAVDRVQIADNIGLNRANISADGATPNQTGMAHWTADAEF